jgi:CRISPR/Cas system Type II protein with McrA/HNH and RuvC-like nuclease domain
MDIKQTPLEKIIALRDLLETNGISAEPIIYILTKDEANQVAEDLLPTIETNDRLELARGIGKGVAWKMLDGSKVHGFKVAVNANG